MYWLVSLPHGGRADSVWSQLQVRGGWLQLDCRVLRTTCTRCRCAVGTPRPCVPSPAALHAPTHPPAVPPGSISFTPRPLRLDPQPTATQELTTYANDYAHNFRFALPESFRVGTLDSLLGLSDDLAKVRGPPVALLAVKLLVACGDGVGAAARPVG